jgi:hypothetical protein
MKDLLGWVILVIVGFTVTVNLIKALMIDFMKTVLYLHARYLEY